jgi:hypothetical protein
MSEIEVVELAEREGNGLPEFRVSDEHYSGGRRWRIVEVIRQSKNPGRAIIKRVPIGLLPEAVAS